jgi:hypothetical protein
MFTKPAIVTVATLALAAVLGPTGQAQTSSKLAALKTTAEASDYKSTSSYADVVSYMKTVADAAPTLVHYTTYGTTYENRPMPMAVVGTGLRDISPAAVRATGKLRIHIQGNIHAGEVEGKESAQELLRDFAMGKHKDWLQSSVFLITPIFNADGNEKISMTNRGPQNGPINGQGTRANGQGLNINRDFMKLETPEARAFVKLWNDYDPQVGFDLHTSDGSTHGYYLTYSPPLNPDTNEAIVAMMKGEWFPFITKNIKDKHGWDTFYYGNAPQPGRGRGAQPTPDVVGAPPPAPPAMRNWATFEPVARFHNNYAGMRNRFGLLSEAYAYATFEDRIKATNYFLEEALTFAHQNAARIQKACADADREMLVGKTEGTRAQLKRGGTVEILMGEVDKVTNPNNGAVMNLRKDVVHPEQMIDMMWFEPTATEEVPATYYVPADATKALDLLKLHGIEMRQVQAPVAGVEQFAISGMPPSQGGNPADLGSHVGKMIRLQGAWQPAAGVSTPAGSWEVKMTQPLARLAFDLIAPTSDDGLVAWNFLDDQLKDAKTYPILRKR